MDEAQRPDPDGPLVDLLRRGDRDAFDEIVKRHQRSLKKLVQRYVSDAAEAEDVVQAALLRAYERVADFRGESAFRTWLFRIAINGALSRLRVTPTVPLDELEDVAMFTRSLQTSRLVAAEVWERVRQRLDELPARQRLVLELRVFHDLSFEEIAVIVESSEDAAKVNFHHAVKRLRGILSLGGERS
jgi:RNA polymerase sigma-70 factor (ECF subfamily)